MSDGIEAEIDRLMLKRRAAVRQKLVESGCHELVKEYDRDMRDCDTGVIGARRCWAALSDVQRFVIVTLSDDGGFLLRRSTTLFALMTTDGKLRDVSFCGMLAASNLIVRALLECDGSALDPEMRLNITERGRFVRKFGGQ